MGWFRRVVSELGLGLSLFGASVAGIDPREIIRQHRRRHAPPPPADDRPDRAPSAAGVPSDTSAAGHPPPGHPERLVPHQPLTDEERRLWSQLP
ncbi:DUF6059 family protein [Micromonospora sp. WMMD558]|uniref:DUF6059 family protein n=1 Tax=unclassified Micromonospora TaxID=2617518 RepID=UPI0012B45859|nr:DUF6059 family protein [Micromonospora sp. WMMC415]QGN47259.1 hypothetical protein GKC29_10650 [Micromonospora sp. WMMC415]